MTDPERLSHNAEQLAQCYGPFRDRARLVLDGQEARGMRPRIAAPAWRSSVLQAAAVAAGNSQVKWSFHQATAKDGTPESLAIDVLDDDYPMPSPHQSEWPAQFRAFVFWLAALAESRGLETGGVFGLRGEEREAWLHAIRNAVEPVVWLGAIGWDPCHVEPGGNFTTAAARAGRRPWAEGS